MVLPGGWIHVIAIDRLAFINNPHYVVAVLTEGNKTRLLRYHPAATGTLLSQGYVGLQPPATPSPATGSVAGAPQAQANKQRSTKFPDRTLPTYH
jgi:hypothetical protein